MNPKAEPVVAEDAAEKMRWQQCIVLPGILLAGLVATGIATYYTRPVAETTARQEFEFDCRAIQDRIAGRIAACEQVLRNGTAFFGHTYGNVRQAWRQFVEHQRIERGLTGVQGVGFALWIPREQLAEHVRAVRAEGFADYQVRPAGDREAYTSIVYLEPFTNRNLRAFGYDMWSEPVRRAAMERARDFDVAALTDTVRLVQETEVDVQAGTLMYVPVFRAGQPVETVDQRRAALQGWVYSPYRMTDLMRGILGGWDLLTDRRIRLEVFDGKALLYDSQAGERLRTADPNLILQTRVDAAGRQWTLRFTKTGGLTARASLVKVWLVLFGGVIGSLLLVGLIANLLTTRFQARKRASQLDVTLRENQTHLAMVMEATDNGFLLVDPKGKILNMNRQFAKLWRIPDVMMQSGDDEALLRHVTGQLADPEEFLREVARLYRSSEEKLDQVRFKDGRVFERHTNVVELDGKRIGRLWSFRDLTARKQAEDLAARATQLLQSVIDHSQCLVYAKDTDGRFILASQPLAAFFGQLAQAQLLGKTSHDFLPETVADQHWANDREAMARQSTVLCEETVETPDGLRTFLSIKFPLLDAAGEIYAVGGTSFDITEHKQAEAKIKNQLDELLRWQTNMSGREIRMIALKRQVNELSTQLGRPRPYPLAFMDKSAEDIVRNLSETDSERSTDNQPQREKT